jgi:RND family efflux transporter MFP subunit
MDEALDQQAAIIFPSSKTKAVVTRAHAELARHSGNGAICSIPLNGPTDTVGVITFERTEDQPFDSETVQLFESISALVGPVLEVQRRDDRWLLRKAIDAINAQLRAVIGPRHIATKLTVFAVVTLVLFFTFATGKYRVTAKTVIEPASRQAVVAAYDGYVSTADVRAGDLVRKNQVLAQLDDRKLKLERSKWQSQQEQSLRQYYEALGNRNAAQVQILSAQVAQARAQVALLDEEISRAKVIAPVDGVIVTGDLSQSLGAPVERGQVLFELAPLDSYRIVLQVDERQIGDVAVGQHGRLILAGFADDPLDFSVGRLTPVSTAGDGRNFFRVEARLENVPERLRPGMEGVGKIEIDRRGLIWIWTHEVVDWLRLKTWNWLP